MEKVAIGRTVIYKANDEDLAYMENPNNIANKQEELPAVIVAVWGDECVNLKVLLDGEGTLWKTSAMKGENKGEWHFPVKE